MVIKMYRTMLKSKIHRAVVTEANLNYVGSITIAADLMEKAELAAYEKVQVVNINSGARLETYVIPGPPRSGAVCLNGAAARLVQPGDLVIIISYALVPEEKVKGYLPTVVFVDGKNRVTKVAEEKAFSFGE